MTRFPPHSEQVTTAVQGTVFGHRGDVVHRLIASWRRLVICVRCRTDSDPVE